MDNNDYETLYTKYHNKIYKFCLKNLYKNHHDAEDVTAEVFYTLLNKKEELNLDGNIYTWLCKTAINCIKQYNRKRKFNYKLLDEIIDSEENVYPDSLIINYIEKDYEFKEFIDIIIADLDEEQKQIFINRYITKMTLQEISKIMNIPYSSIRYKLNIITKKVDDIIENKYSKYN